MLVRKLTLSLTSLSEPSGDRQFRQTKYSAAARLTTALQCAKKLGLPPSA
jgi:hypothetical protein